MTLPSNLYELLTLETVLQNRGEDVKPLYKCPSCPRKFPAQGLVSTEGLPGTLPAFICHTCASGPYREACAEIAAQEAEAAGPDWSGVQAQRNTLLSRCDWTQVNDAPLTEQEKTAWVAYRQQLRDITSTFNHPQDVVWPNPPVLTGNRRFATTLRQK